MIPNTVATLSMYFIQSGPNGPIKIGVAADVFWRASILQIGNPLPLFIMATTPAANESIEAEIHARFAEVRLCGEWFEPTQGLLDFIESTSETWAGPQLASYYRANGIKAVKHRYAVRRYPVAMEEETRRSLKFISADTGETMEQLAGRLLADAVRREREKLRR